MEFSQIRPPKRKRTISDFFLWLDRPLGVDDDFLLVRDRDDSCEAVRRTGVVDQSAEVALLGGVDHHVVIHAEHIRRPDPLLLVDHLAFFAQLRPDDLP